MSISLLNNTGYGVFQLLNSLQTLDSLPTPTLFKTLSKSLGELLQGVP